MWFAQSVVGENSEVAGWYFVTITVLTILCVLWIGYHAKHDEDPRTQPAPPEPIPSPRNFRKKC